MSERISGARRLAYCLGQAGFQLTDRIVVVMAVYFYLPPPGRGLVPQVPEQLFLGFLTVYGLAMLIGRVFDSAADPLVGHASDRSRSPLGRRRVFLIAGLAPMVAVPTLLFFPPAPPGSAWNGVWMALLLVLYFTAFTVYVGPFLALIPELAESESDRVRLATLLALVSFPVVAIFGSAWGMGLDLGRAAGLSPADAMRAIAIGASLLALLLCLGPIFAVDERRFARGVPSDLPLRRAIAETFANRPFRLYLAAMLALIFAVNLIQPSLPYLATVVLGRSEGFALWLGLGLFTGIATGIGLLRRLVEWIGPKRSMLLCLAALALTLGALGFLRADVPGGPHDRWNLALTFGSVALLGVPVSGFLVLPHVLIGQLVDLDARHTGANRAAMYFGIQGLVTKWMYGVAIWVFTFLLSRYGNSPEQPWGVIAVGPVAAGACLVSLAIFSSYPERRILAAIRSESAQAPLHGRPG
jgi:GPH family glycoside/pentoside/hexuronide:cation symporter